MAGRASVREFQGRGYYGGGRRVGKVSSWEHTLQTTAVSLFVSQLAVWWRACSLTSLGFDSSSVKCGKDLWLFLELWWSKVPIHWKGSKQSLTPCKGPVPVHLCHQENLYGVDVVLGMCSRCPGSAGRAGGQWAETVKSGPQVPLILFLISYSTQTINFPKNGLWFQEWMNKKCGWCFFISILLTREGRWRPWWRKRNVSPVWLVAQNLAS